MARNYGGKMMDELSLDRYMKHAHKQGIPNVPKTASVIKVREKPRDAFRKSGKNGRVWKYRRHDGE